MNILYEIKFKIIILNNYFEIISFYNYFIYNDL